MNKITINSNLVRGRLEYNSNGGGGEDEPQFPSSFLSRRVSSSSEKLDKVNE